MKKPVKIILIVCLSVYVLAFCGLVIIPFSFGAFTGLYTGIKDGIQSRHWREKTRPINSEIVDELCSQFKISPKEHVCKSGEVVYGPEFYPYIAKAFCPEKNRCVSVDIVEEKIGKYKYDADLPETLSPGVLNRFWYDFQEDHLYPLVISFNLDGSIRRIMYDFGD